VKTFIVTYRTNYGLSVMLINSDDIESAKFIAKEKGAWNGFEVEEVDLLTKGVIFWEES
jgi:hypothetical protein